MDELVTNCDRFAALKQMRRPTCGVCHDRFIVVDQKEIFWTGASLKDAGRLTFVAAKMGAEMIARPPRLRPQCGQRTQGVRQGGEMTFSLLGKTEICQPIAIGNEGVKSNDDEGANEGVKILLGVIRSSPGKRANELASLIGKSVQSVERYVKVLKEAGAVEFRGAPKNGGYYAIHETEVEV